MKLRILHRREFDGPSLVLSGRALAAWTALDASTAQDRAWDSDSTTALRRLLNDRIRPRRSIVLSAQFEDMFAAGRLHSPGAALAVLTLELQRFYGEHVRIWSIAGADEQGRIMVAVACEDHAIARLAMDAARDALELVSGGDLPGELPEAISRFMAYAEAHQPDTMMRPLLDAARARGIPYVRLNESGRFGRFAQLGQGRHRRLIAGTTTDATSTVASAIATSKRQTNRILDRLGFPVPAQALALSVDQARAVAARIGFPVVVKPDGGNGGVGITAGVRDDRELTLAFERARLVHPTVVIEKFLEGEDFRLLVAGGEMIAATWRQRPQIVGDGRRSVCALVEEMNADPLRGEAGRSDMVLLKFDAPMLALLARQDLSPDSIPGEGHTVLLATTANIKSGGVPVDVLPRVHPDNKDLAETIAAALRLEFIGIDFLTTDIARSCQDVPCGVIEVNVSPGLGMYGPIEGESDRVAGRIMATIFPPGSATTIPLVVIASGRDGHPAAIAARAAALLGAGGHATAWYDGADVRLGDALHRRSVPDARAAGSMILGHPRAAAGVLLCDDRHITEHGLPWPVCDVAVAAGLALPQAAALVAATATRAVVSTFDEPHLTVIAGQVVPGRLILVGEAAATRPAAIRALAGRSVLWSVASGSLHLTLHGVGEPRMLSTFPDPGDNGLRAAAACAAAVALGLAPG